MLDIRLYLLISGLVFEFLEGEGVRIYHVGSHPSYMRSPTIKPPPCQLTIVACSALSSDCNVFGIKMVASTGWSLTLLNVRSILLKSPSLLDGDVILERRRGLVSKRKKEKEGKKRKWGGNVSELATCPVSARPILKCLIQLYLQG